MILLAKQKTTQLKKEAAEALEPELRRLIHGHKDDLQRRRNDMERNLKTVGEEIKLECTEKYSKMKRDIQTEERELLQRTDDHFEGRVKDLISQHEERVEEVRNRLQEERVASEAAQRALVREKENILKARVYDVEVQNKKKISDAEELIAEQLSQLQNKVDEEIRIVKKKQEE